jgi:hypothetical protein
MITCNPKCVFLRVCNSFHSLATKYVLQTETDISLLLEVAGSDSDWDRATLAELTA